MRRDLIQRDLVEMDCAARSQGEFFHHMADKLERLGYVHKTFRQAIMVREDMYPTALPTHPQAIAIPHTEPAHLVRPFIAPTRLRSPIGWREMGNSSVELHVQFIFVLGFIGDDEHIELLQTMVNSFMEDSFVRRLETADTEDRFYKAVRSMRGLTF